MMPKLHKIHCWWIEYWINGKQIAAWLVSDHIQHRYVNRLAATDILSTCMAIYFQLIGLKPGAPETDCHVRRGRGNTI